MADGEGTTAVAEKPKRAKRPAEKALEMVFESREKAQAAIPAGARKLRVMKFVCKLGEAFVVAAKVLDGLDVFARNALGVTSEDTKPGRVKKVKIESRLDDIIKAAESGDTATTLANLKKVQEELLAARARQKAKAAANAEVPAAPAVPPTA
jgi:hypothetical protein